MTRLRVPLALSGAALLAVAGCAGGGADTAASESPGAKRPVVVTDMYPTTFAVQQVAGEAVEVVQLAPPGVEPHEYELTPKQVQQIADADLVAYLPGMIPAVQEAVEQEAAGKGVDVTEGIELIRGQADQGADTDADSVGSDPHVWLDPKNVAIMGANAAKALAPLGVATDAAALDKEMSSLGQDMRTALGNCRIKDLVTAHEAFAYLANAHGFEQVGISGLSPDAQPSPAKMAEITDLVKGKGITTIYFEELLPQDSAEAIAAETGAKTALLDPIEGNTGEKGYSAIMRTNTDTLKAGQSCS